MQISHTFFYSIYKLILNLHTIESSSAIFIKNTITYTIYKIRSINNIARYQYIISELSSNNTEILIVLTFPNEKKEAILVHPVN